jgi:DNA recombination protein RmuC
VLESALVVIALFFGGAVAWVAAWTHLGSRGHAERRVRDMRIAELEARADELRRQLGEKSSELDGVRREIAAERSQRADSDARLDEARKSLDEQRRVFDEARVNLKETFEALSHQALSTSNSEFLKLAEERLGRRQQEIDASLTPLRSALERYEGEIRGLEQARDQAYGSLRTEVERLARLSERLQGETGNLVNALRSPQVRGRWGEVTLHRVVELAGMTEHCDYVEQVTIESEGGRLRPDMVVNLPGGRAIVVDAKVPLAAYLEATGTASDDERRDAMARHARQVRDHMTALAAKAYWEQFTTAPELVVMFIPGESFVGAAAQADPALIEDGMNRKVVVATPTTLVALLRAIAYGWRQEQVATNAEGIRKLGSELYDRLRTLAGHFDSVGGALGRAVNAYNAFVGSMETRVLPSARRFRDLGAATGEEIAPLAAVEQAPRQPDAPEYPRQLTTSDAADEGRA